MNDCHICVAANGRGADYTGQSRQCNSTGCPWQQKEASTRWRSMKSDSLLCAVLPGVFKYLQASSSQPVVGLTGTATSNGGQTVANVFGSAVSYSNVYVCILCVVNAALLIKVLHQIIDFNTVFIVPWVMM